MIPVNDFMTDALAEVLRRAPLTPEKVEFAWRHAVGPAVARATTVALDGQQLTVRVDSGQWRREIERSSIVIRGRLDRLLGKGTVRTLTVVAPPEPRKPRIGVR
jgi:hypothetical protein